MARKKKTDDETANLVTEDKEAAPATPSKEEAPEEAAQEAIPTTPAAAQPESPQSFDDNLNQAKAPEAEAPVSQEDYEDLKQKLLKEYHEQKNDPSTDPSEEAPQPQAQESDSHLEEPAEEEDDHSNSQEPEEEDHPEQDSSDEDSSEELSNDYFSNNDHDDQLNIDQNKINDNLAPDVDQGISKVAISKQSSIAVMIVVAIIMIFVIYKFLQSSKPTTPKPEINSSAPLVTATPETGQTINVPEIPKLPTAPTITVPVPNASAPPPPPIANVTIQAPPPALPAVAASAVAPAAFAHKDSQAELASKKARLNSSMISGGGAGPHPENVSKSGQSLTILKRNTDQITATYIGDLRRVIAEGKIIDAILESAINTDLPGIVRAIVTRDVYSEAGKNVLVARGSRLIGSYSSNVTFGINRVNITWTRLIRPDGVDVNIRAPGTDQLGRAGNAGDLNNHLMLSLTSAVMSSIIDIAVAAYADSQSPPPTGATTSVSGGSTTGAVITPTSPTTATSVQGTTTTAPSVSTTTSTPTQEQQAYLTASQNISQVGTNYLNKVGSMGPTITIDQGTLIKVFVNKDIVFPGVSANLTKVVE